MALKEYFHFTGPSSFPAHRLQAGVQAAAGARVTPLEGTALFNVLHCDGDLLMRPTGVKTESCREFYTGGFN